MKTETQIAQENIKLLLGKRGDREDTTRCKSHKATCQRFLEWLELKFNPIRIEGDEEFVRVFSGIKEKKNDLKQAIKLYNETGI